MERYKEELNNIHAPEALIMKTLARVHEEEKKVEAEKAENINNSNSTNNVTNIFEARSNFQKLDNEYGGETEYKPEKASYRKLKTFVKVGGGIVAAAAVILLALGAAGLNNSMNSASESSDSTSYSGQADSTEASADDSYDDMAEMAAEECDDSAAMSEAEDSQGSSAASSAASSASNSADDSDGIFYNDLSDNRSKEKNSFKSYSSKTESLDMSETADDTTAEDDKSAGSESELTSMSINSDENLVEIDLTEYNEYLGIELSEYLDRIPGSTFIAYAEYDGEIIVDDIGSTKLEVLEGNGTFTVSKARMVGPENLRSGTASVIGGTNVYVGKNGESLYAVFTINGVNYYINTNGTTQEEFESILRNILG